MFKIGRIKGYISMVFNRLYLDNRQNKDRQSIFDFTNRICQTGNLNQHNLQSNHLINRSRNSLHDLIPQRENGINQICNLGGSNSGAHSARPLQIKRISLVRQILTILLHRVQIRAHARYKVNQHFQLVEQTLCILCLRLGNSGIQISERRLGDMVRRFTEERVDEIHATERAGDHWPDEFTLDLDLSVCADMGKDVVESQFDEGEFDPVGVRGQILERMERLQLANS
jgi:hypothetical protein